MANTNRLMRGAALGAVYAAAMACSLPAQASDAGWFLGGVLATKLAGAIKQSVQQGEIDLGRHQSYLAILTELREDAADRSARRRRES